jgi:putative flippase GtrA
MISTIEPVGADVETVPSQRAWGGRVLAFGRFVLVGGASTGLASGLFLLFGIWMPAVLANTAAAVLSTVAANRAHAQWTFRSGRTGAGMQVGAGLTAALSYGVTTASLLTLHWLDPSAGRDLELGVLIGASALAGILRYLLLLVGVFPDSPVSFDRSARHRREGELVSRSGFQAGRSYSASRPSCAPGR